MTPTPWVGVEALAHQLKQPLAVAWGYLELLLEDPSLVPDPTARQYLQEISLSLQSMRECLDQERR